MHVAIGKDSVDERIHRFIERKRVSAWNEIGQVAEGRFTANDIRSSDKDMSYELLQWRHANGLFRQPLGHRNQ